MGGTGRLGSHLEAAMGRSRGRGLGSLKYFAQIHHPSLSYLRQAGAALIAEVASGCAGD